MVQLGINDLSQGVPLETIRSNLQAIIEQARAASPGVGIVVVGMQLPDYTEENNVTEFGRIYAGLAQENGAAFVPYLLAGVAGNPAYSLPDRLHPNAEGQKSWPRPSGRRWNRSRAQWRAGKADRINRIEQD